MPVSRIRSSAVIHQNEVREKNRLLSSRASHVKDYAEWNARTSTVVLEGERTFYKISHYNMYCFNCILLPSSDNT